MGEEGPWVSDLHGSYEPGECQSTVGFNSHPCEETSRWGGVALRDDMACGIVGGGGINQIASRSSSNAVASRYTGTVSTPSS